MNQQPRQWPEEWLSPQAPDPETGAEVVNMPTQCLLCQHFQDVDPITGVATCAAFTQGIPWRIWSGLDPHLEPIKGDGGLQYTGPDLGLENVPPESPQDMDEDEKPPSSWTPEELAEIGAG